MAISIAGYVFYEKQKENLKQEKWGQLGAVADLKVSQIANWRKERVGDGGIIFESPFIGPRLQQWFQDPKTTGLEKEILSWMASLPRQYQSYERVLLLDAKGIVRLSVPEGEKVLDSFSKTLVLEAARDKRVMLSDLYRDETLNIIRLSLLVPILIRKGESPATVAVILLRIDPQRFLYPLIQTWPTPSRTSETLLIRREGDEVVFLNELRRRKNTALTLRFPISRQELPAAMAAQGQEKVTEGFDYWGAPVLVATRRIPDSPWFLVAKVDQEEIYAPILMEARLIAVLVGVLVIGVAVSVGFLWRGQYLKAQRRSENALRESEQRFRSVLENSVDGVFRRNLQTGRFDYLSPAIQNLTGYSVEEVSSFDINAFLGLIHPDDLSVVQREIKRELAECRAVGQATGNSELRFKHKDGEYRWLATNTKVLADPDGQPLYRLGVVRNITERKRAEEALRQRDAELERVNKELEAFSYSVSHDLRTPLVGISGLSEILLGKYSQDLPKKGQHCLRVIQREAQNMLQLIDDLMAFSRFQRQEIKHAPIDMSRLAKTVCDGLKSMMPKQGMKVDIKPLLPARGDRAMIRQVFHNLLSNAIKFTKPREAGIIEIGCLTGENDHIYYVKDNGVGFEMQHAANLFEAFQRLHSAEEFEGTGIGLAIVQRIIHRHGGRVWADGKVNEGAIFYFALPIKQP